MTDLLSSVQAVLQDAGFGTRLIDLDKRTVVSFEDEVAMGFVAVFDSPIALLSGWQAVETSLLRRYAPNLREAGDKAWNVYSVFLSSAAGDESVARQVRWIEEDLDRTRKLAACGIVTRDDLILALLPILPLQYQPQLETADLRGGSGNLDRGIGDGSALCDDDNAADERSREHETTPP